jgi:phosphatidylglycerophosphatase A
MGRDDPGEIVIDEVAGLWVALALTPQALALPALFLFRVIDILKPFPVNAAERLPGGVGIMADDVVGGLLTAALLLGLRWLFIQGGLARLIGA